MGRLKNSTVSGKGRGPISERMSLFYKRYFAQGIIPNSSRRQSFIALNAAGSNLFVTRRFSLSFL